MTTFTTHLIWHLSCLRAVASLLSSQLVTPEYMFSSRPCSTLNFDLLSSTMILQHYVNHNKNRQAIQHSVKVLDTTTPFSANSFLIPSNANNNRVEQTIIIRYCKGVLNIVESLKQIYSLLQDIKMKQFHEYAIAPQINL